MSFSAQADMKVMLAGHSHALPLEQPKPAISVIGLGYVGAVSMACLAHLGFRMVGVDISRDRVRTIRAGRSPIVEDRLGELLTEGASAGRIEATQNAIAAVLSTDVTFVSVGTPTAKDGGCDFTYVRNASRAVGQALALKNSYHVVVLRCSVPPGTTLDIVVPEIEKASGKSLGPDFGICFNPEFLREGMAVADFFAPPKTVVGASDERAAQRVSGIYGAIDKNVIFTSIEVAEMVKYVDNVWHAAKVAFGNEVGRLCKSFQIDSHEVMDIFVKDTKLNLSPYYLKPAFAFGGSCLPKEVRAVSHIAGMRGVELPLIDSLIPSNKVQIREALRMLAAYKGKRIGFLGITFKSGTDDLRESPTLDLMSALLKDGENLAVFDPNLDFGPLLQAQISHVRNAAPEQAALMDVLEELSLGSIDDLMTSCDVVVVSHATELFRKAVQQRPTGVTIIDLARLFKTPPQDQAYQGIAW
jgi:GDP-mannose 6-dehydrogenase